MIFCGIAHVAVASVAEALRRTIARGKIKGETTKSGSLMLNLGFSRLLVHAMGASVEGLFGNHDAEQVLFEGKAGIIRKTLRIGMER